MKLKGLIVILLVVLLFNPIANAYAISMNDLENAKDYREDPRSYMESADYPGYYLDKKLAVIYDASFDVAAETAIRVYYSTEMIYHNIQLIPVDNWLALADIMNNDSYWIKLYFFDFSINGIKLENSYQNWSTISTMLTNSDNSHHIIGSGSTDQLRKYIPEDMSNVHFDGSAVIDKELSYFYNLWEIGEIFATERNRDYQQVAEDFRTLGIQYFGENLSGLVNKQINPEEPLGEEDVEAIVSDWDQEILAMNEIYQVNPKGGVLNLDAINKPRTSLNLITTEQGDTEKFTIANIPLFSGLEGPTSAIIDTILTLLIETGGGKIGLDKGTAIDIANTIKQLSLILADSTSGGADSKETIKSLLLTVGANAPIPSKLKAFLPVFIDAFFLLRGDVSDIIDFAKTLISTIFNQIGSNIGSDTLSSIVNVLETVFLNGVDLTERLASSEAQAKTNGKSFEIFSEVQLFMMEKLLNFSTYEWLSEIMGDSNSSLLAETSNIMEFVIPLVKAFITREYTTLFQILPDILEYLVNKFQNINSGSTFTFNDKIKSGINIIPRFYQLAILLYGEYSDIQGNSAKLLHKGTSTESTIKELLRDLLSEGMPLFDSSLSYLGLDQIDKDQIDITVDSLIDTLKEAAKNQITDKEELRILIESVVAILIPQDDQKRSLLIDGLTLLGSIVIPSIPNPFGVDFKGWILSFLQAIINDTNFSSGQQIELLNALKSQLTSILDTIFGLIAISTNGGPAQMMFVSPDEVVNGKITSKAKSEIYNKVQNQTVNILTVIAKQYVSNKTAELTPLFGDLFINIISAITTGDGDAIKSILQSILLQAINIFISKTLGINGSIASKMILTLFDGFISGKTIRKSAAMALPKQEIKQLSRQALTNKNATTTVKNLADIGIDMLFNLEDLFTNTMDFIFNQLKSAITQLLTSLISKLTSKITSSLNNLPLLQLAGTIGFKGVDFIGLKLFYDLSITPNLEWDTQGFISWMVDIVLKGLTDLELPDIGDFFQKILSFLSITPIFSADFGVESISSGKGGLFSAILGAIGADLTINGKIHFVLQLLSFKAGGFDPEGFVKLLEWGLSITIMVSRDFTLFDVVTAGAGGGPLNKAAKYIGLETIKITLFLSFAFEIIQIAAHNGDPAQGSLTLTLIIGASIYIGIGLAIVELGISAGIDIVLKFFQDLSPGSKKAFQITLDIIFWAKITLKFLFWDWSARFEFRPPGSPYDLTPKSEEDLEKNAFGTDRDRDGLANTLEEANPLLNPDLPDSDSDGLSDKFELRVSNTDPSKKDTDGDGLTDFMEWMIERTNPLAFDTDLDGLNDGEEVFIYRTNPLSGDTDNDLLTDLYEIDTELDISKITPSVSGIVIGFDQFDDRTDPLNPDTDGDGILDGQEGAFGAYWGGEEFFDPEAPDPILVFNEGYIHPLDNDTDDDSYLQFYEGTIAGNEQTKVFLRDMTDGVEIAGILATIVEVDEDGVRELVEKTFYTNPTAPDSDLDTGTGDPRQDQFGFFLNSDGYELSLNPASDPLKGDSDGDGLIDGLEGTLRPQRNVTTDVNNPDTDGDGLPDGLELTIGSDPANPDTDADLVLDGDEFYIYHTSINNPDSDFDGLTDGYELFFVHSNPHSKDSDGDGIQDYDEVFIYGTDPVDEDSDNDNLTDRDEIFEFETDPTSADTDGDGLKDGLEIEIYNTDPNDPDTDNDSILFPNENGDPTFLLTDGLEVLVYGTNPRSQDTDSDGILDSWEIYISDFNIPGFRNLALDPNNNDTDGDLIEDGREMMLNTTKTLTYPFVGVIVYFPLRSSPVSSDTDGDKLNDLFELENNLNANSSDTDGDGLTDFDELFIHLTDPLKYDTDGDSIPDSDEVTNAINNSTLSLSSVYSPKFATSALDPDSDGDGWPDGLEIKGTDGSGLYNPYNPDVNENGMLDGYERDFDSDGIVDGEEYYKYNSASDQHGGFLDYRNPDSDYDGLLDSDEILLYGTKPYNPDTDFDTYSDGLELFVGTNPLVFTTEEDFLDAVRRLKSPLQIRSPIHGKTYASGNIPIQMVNLTSLSDAYFRYRSIGGDKEGEWSNNISLSFQRVTAYSLGAWTSNEINFEQGNIYELVVYGVTRLYKPPASDITLNGTLIFNKVEFTVNNTYFLGIHPAILYSGASIVAISIIMAILTRRGVISPKNWIKRKSRKKGGNR